jgi:PKD domain
MKKRFRMKKDGAISLAALLGVGWMMVASGCEDAAMSTAATPIPTPTPLPLPTSDLEACFTTTPDPPVVDAGETIALNAGCSETAGEASFEWELGDGRTHSGRSLEVRYQRAGTYEVQLTLNANGQRSTMDEEIVVRPRPVACFTYEQVLADDQKPTPCTMIFRATCSEGDVQEYRWFFEGSPFPPYPPPDKNITTTEPTLRNSWFEDPECVVFRPFEKTVRLTVVDDRGITDTREERVLFRVPLSRP